MLPRDQALGTFSQVRTEALGSRRTRGCGPRPAQAGMSVREAAAHLVEELCQAQAPGPDPSELP